MLKEKLEKILKTRIVWDQVGTEAVTLESKYAIEEILTLFKQYIKAKMPEKKSTILPIKGTSREEIWSIELTNLILNVGRNQAIQETTKALLEDL